MRRFIVYPGRLLAALLASAAGIMLWFDMRWWWLNLYAGMILSAVSVRIAPECFLSDPGPQQQAENDCYSCFIRGACLYRKGGHES